MRHASLDPFDYSIILVERDMDNWREEVAILQAQLSVQQMVLKAVVHTHPGPVELLHQWRRLRADRIAAAYELPAGVRTSEWLSQHVQAFAEDWTAELVDAVTRQGERLDVSSSDSDVATP
jgi:hypothetical protein